MSQILRARRYQGVVVQKPQFIRTLEVVEVDGERQHKVKTSEHQTATDERPEEHRDPKSIHQSEFPRVARRVARVPEASSDLKKREGRGQ